MCVTGSKPILACADVGAGQEGGWPKSTAIMSASFPTARLPVTLSRPNALAPFRVAIRMATWAGHALASLATALATSDASFISAMTSSVLFDEAPSVPRATLTPAFWRSATRQKPLASLRLLEGQWTTLTPDSAHQPISSSVSQFMCTAIRRLFSMPSRLMLASGVHFWSLRWQLFDSLSPLALSLHSSSVSWRCMWSGVSYFSLRALPFSSVASEMVKGAWREIVQEMRGSALNCSIIFSPLAK
mmetsp:Transcript_641/g.1810  ORF Transcript_641/g.1810 Transcript_641/m.1810 type:complete len:245 (+) Transcript_641:220-954(+)